MRTTITTNPDGSVTLSYDCEWYEFETMRLERTFFCSANGGYVRETGKNGEYPQVCYGLSDRGVTLYCQSRDKLADMIRREYRAMRRNERAQHA